MTVVFGPYVGEFGWEVRAWAPHVYARVRRMRVAGDQRPVIIVAREGSRALYEPSLAIAGVDFESDWDWPKAPAEYMHLHHPAAQAAWEERIDERLLGRKAQVICPRPGEAFAESCLEDIKKHGYEGCVRMASVPTGIALCVRGRTDLGLQRNYAQWPDLAPMLGKLAWCLRKVADCSAGEALRDIWQSRVAVGESSGKMHLAATAGVPFVVWGEAKNRARYEHDNWHGVPFRFIDGLQPEPKVIADAVKDLLKEIERGV